MIGELTCLKVPFLHRLCVLVAAADNYIRNATVVVFYGIEWRHDRSKHCPSATRVKLHFKRKKLARLFQSSSRVSVLWSPFSREITLSRLFIVLMCAFYVLLASAWNLTCVLSVALITLQINWMRVGCIRRDSFIACSCKLWKFVVLCVFWNFSVGIVIVIGWNVYFGEV